MSGIGWQELLIVFVILILVFGAAKLPSLAKSMGQSVGSFKKGMREDLTEEPAKAEAPQDEAKPGAGS
jgi:sec-independent protein translocase protein TatA